MHELKNESVFEDVRWRSLQWILTALAALVMSPMLLLAPLALGGCGDNQTCLEPLPRVAPCVQFEADIRGVDEDLVVPSIVPADFGVRIIVDADFTPLMGSSYPVPGGRMVWNVWVYHWLDGDHLGAIGRVPDVQVVGPIPRGGVCQWYDPL